MCAAISTDVLLPSTPDTMNSSSSSGASASLATPKNAPDYPEWRRWEIAEKYLDRFEYGSPDDDYADSVGISRYGEL